MEELFTDPESARLVEDQARTVDKGHGRLERREIRTSTALCGYSTFPGLAQVAEVRTQVVRLKTGELRESVHYLVSSLPPEQADARRLLALMRSHWGIENRLFHVKDDSFGEDRQVLQSHRAGTLLGLLRGAMLNLLRGRCALWRDQEPLTGRAERVAAHPLAILAVLD